MAVLVSLAMLAASAAGAATHPRRGRHHGRHHARHHRARQAAGTSGGAGIGQDQPAPTPGPVASAPTAPTAPSGSAAPSTGAASPVSPAPTAPAEPTVPGLVAKIVNGVAYAPSEAPLPVQEAIWAGDQIRTKPYIYGGGHGSFNSPGYDCSGSVSYVLHAAGLLAQPFDSSQFMSWGQRGIGQWMTVYTNPGHAFIEIAGIRFDTSSEADPHPARGTGPRWRPLYPHPRGFMARHPAGF